MHPAEQFQHLLSGALQQVARCPRPSKLFAYVAAPGRRREMDNLLTYRITRHRSLPGETAHRRNRRMYKVFVFTLPTASPLQVSFPQTACLI